MQKIIVSILVLLLALLVASIAMFNLFALGAWSIAVVLIGLAIVIAALVLGYYFDE